MARRVFDEIFDPLGVHDGWCAGFVRRLAQETGLFGAAFNQVNLRSSCVR
jgi:hypothetical protein